MAWAPIAWAPIATARVRVDGRRSSMSSSLRHLYARCGRMSSAADESEASVREPGERSGGAPGGDSRRRTPEFNGRQLVLAGGEALLVLGGSAQEIVRCHAALAEGFHEHQVRQGAGTAQGTGGIDLDAGLVEVERRSGDEPVQHRDRFGVQKQPREDGA